MTNQTLEINGNRCGPDTWTDISIPLRFGTDQPNAYGVPSATGEACEAGPMVGDTRRGGSCNFEEYKLIPHCNGTHTECVGHITKERISVLDCLKDVLMSALVVSVTPVAAKDAGESYACEFEESNRIISAASLRAALGERKAEAMVIRTLPNDESKLSRKYADSSVPFFSNDALRLINDLGFRHLLVDLPSIDRLSDEGKLSNHRIFWGMAAGSHDRPSEDHCTKTVTELIYVPDSVADGLYELNLQIAPFEADAAPSRPMLRQ